jgi:hypothetical protein
MKLNQSRYVCIAFKSNQRIYQYEEGRVTLIPTFHNQYKDGFDLDQPLHTIFIAPGDAHVFQQSNKVLRVSRGSASVICARVLFIVSNYSTFQDQVALPPSQCRHHRSCKWS